MIQKRINYATLYKMWTYFSLFYLKLPHQSISQRIHMQRIAKKLHIDATYCHEPPITPWVTFCKIKPLCVLLRPTMEKKKTQRENRKKHDLFVCAVSQIASTLGVTPRHEIWFILILVSMDVCCLCLRKICSNMLR